MQDQNSLNSNTPNNSEGNDNSSTLIHKKKQKIKKNYKVNNKNSVTPKKKKKVTLVSILEEVQKRTIDIEKEKKEKNNKNEKEQKELDRLLQSYLEKDISTFLPLEQKSNTHNTQDSLKSNPTTVKRSQDNILKSNSNEEENIKNNINVLEVTSNSVPGLDENDPHTSDDQPFKCLNNETIDQNNSLEIQHNIIKESNTSSIEIKLQLPESAKKDNDFNNEISSNKKDEPNEPSQKKITLEEFLRLKDKNQELFTLLKDSLFAIKNLFNNTQLEVATLAHLATWYLICEKLSDKKIEQIPDMLQISLEYYFKEKKGNYDESHYQKLKKYVSCLCDHVMHELNSLDGELESPKILNIIKSNFLCKIKPASEEFTFVLNPQAFQTVVAFFGIMRNKVADLDFKISKKGIVVDVSIEAENFVKQYDKQEISFGKMEFLTRYSFLFDDKDINLNLCLFVVRNKTCNVELVKNLIDSTQGTDELRMSTSIFIIQKAAEKITEKEKVLLLKKLAGKKYAFLKPKLSEIRSLFKLDLENIFLKFLKSSSGNNNFKLGQAAVRYVMEAVLSQEPLTDKVLKISYGLLTWLLVAEKMKKECFGGQFGMEESSIALPASSNYWFEMLETKFEDKDIRFVVQSFTSILSKAFSDAKYEEFSSMLLNISSFFLNPSSKNNSSTSQLSLMTTNNSKNDPIKLGTEIEQPLLATIIAFYFIMEKMLTEKNTEINIDAVLSRASMLVLQYTEQRKTLIISEIGCYAKHDLLTKNSNQMIEFVQNSDSLDFNLVDILIGSTENINEDRTGICCQIIVLAVEKMDIHNNSDLFEAIQDNKYSFLKLEGDFSSTLRNNIIITTLKKYCSQENVREAIHLDNLILVFPEKLTDAAWKIENTYKDSLLCSYNSPENFLSRTAANTKGKALFTRLNLIKFIINNQQDFNFTTDDLEMLKDLYGTVDKARIEFISNQKNDSLQLSQLLAKNQFQGNESYFERWLSLIIEGSTVNTKSSGFFKSYSFPSEEQKNLFNCLQEKRAIPYVKIDDNNKKSEKIFAQAYYESFFSPQVTAKIIECEWSNLQEGKLSLLFGQYLANQYKLYTFIHSSHANSKTEELLKNLSDSKRSDTQRWRDVVTYCNNKEKGTCLDIVLKPVFKNDPELIEQLEYKKSDSFSGNHLFSEEQPIMVNIRKESPQESSSSLYSLKELLSDQPLDLEKKVLLRQKMN